MGLVEEFLEKHRIGEPIFLKLFELKKDKLIEVLKKVLASYPRPMDIFEDGTPRVTKITEDDVPDKIFVACYDVIVITSTGIRFKPEHKNEERVLDFNEFFTLGDMI